jgi:predicted peptidase
MAKLLISLLLLLPVVAFTQGYPSFEKKELIRGTDTLRYRVQYPFNYNPSKKYPLVLFLHGAGERGSDNELQLAWGAALFADSNNRAKFPAIVVFPQCRRDDFWPRIARNNNKDSLGGFSFLSNVPVGKSLGLVEQLIDSMAASGKINMKKIYLGGLSMGGMGTFELLWRKPNFFAAALPICGGGDPLKPTEWARKFPIWVFHGEKDPVVPPSNSRLMVNALKAAKAKVKYSEYPGVLHDSWKNAFAEPELLSWLFKQKK